MPMVYPDYDDEYGMEDFDNKVTLYVGNRVRIKSGTQLRAQNLGLC